MPIPTDYYQYASISVNGDLLYSDSSNSTTVNVVSPATGATTLLIDDNGNIGASMPGTTQGLSVSTNLNQPIPAVGPTLATTTTTTPLTSIDWQTWLIIIALVYFSYHTWGGR